ncbi:MAG: TAXI family TRAP transporter solute-binding subunit [Gammaproteobacteria bacterium]|nr:TAXI family TRAP transporter solute-binding subunit [Gammaproteobacteria bacterium]
MLVNNVHHKQKLHKMICLAINMKSRLGVVFLGLGFIAALYSPHGFSKTLSFATGNPSGLYYPIGGAMSSLWSKTLIDFNMKAEVTGGSLANVIQVAIGEGEVGITQGNVAVDAYLGEGRFPYELPINVLFAAYPNVVQVVTRADSGIETLEDLRGHKVSLGGAGSGTMITAINILDALEVDTADMDVQYLNYTETANAIRDGKISAGFIVGGAGVSAIIELAYTRDIRLLSFSDQQVSIIENRYPAYVSYVLPPDVYQRVPETPLLAVWNVLVVNKNMDDELAYTMTKVVFDNIDLLSSSNPVLNSMTVDTKKLLALVPLHPGSQRYFNEQMENQ